MIEFNGYITGVSEKHFSKRSRAFVQNLFIVFLLLVLPTVVVIAIKTHESTVPLVYVSFSALSLLAIRLPKSKKERQKMNPKKITIQDGVMIAINGYGPDSKLVSDVKEVRDYGEFYEIVFPFGKMSTNFICQKDLLVKGSLEKFEKIFKDKLVRK